MHEYPVDLYQTLLATQNQLNRRRVRETRELRLEFLSSSRSPLPTRRVFVCTRHHRENGQLGEEEMRRDDGSREISTRSGPARLTETLEERVRITVDTERAVAPLPAEINYCRNSVRYDRSTI